MTIQDRKSWINKIQNEIVREDTAFLREFIEYLLWTMKGTDEDYLEILDEAHYRINYE